MPTLDNQLALLSSGAADWDADLDANFAVIERGYHVTQRAGVAINTGEVLWCNSAGYFKQFDPNSTSIFPMAMAFTAAASGDSMRALAWGIVRSLAINSAGVSGKLLYVSAATPGVIVSSSAVQNIPVGLGLPSGGVLFDPSRVATSAGGGVTKVLSLSDVNPAGLADGSILKWSNSSSKFTMQVDSAGGGGSSITVGTQPAIVQVNTLETTSSSAAFTFSSTPTVGNLILFMGFGGNGWSAKDDGVTAEFGQYGANYGSNPMAAVYAHISDGRKSYAFGDNSATDFMLYGVEISNAGNVDYLGVSANGQFKINSGDHFTSPRVYSKWGKTLVWNALGDTGSISSSTVNSGWGLAWGAAGGPQAKGAISVMSNPLAAGSSYYCNWVLHDSPGTTHKPCVIVVVNPVITF